MRIITFTDENEENFYPFYVGESSIDIMPDTYTGLTYQGDAFDELIELIYNNWGTEFTFTGLFCGAKWIYGLPDSGQEQYIYPIWFDHLKQLTSYGHENYPVYYTDNINDVVSNLSTIPYDTFLHLKGSDPETRRYIKFFTTSPYCKVYNHNKEEQMGTWRFGRWLATVWSNTLSKILITDFEAFKNAESGDASQSYLREYVVDIFDFSASAQTGDIHYIEYDISVSRPGSSAYNALWYLLQTGADVDTPSDDPYSDDDAPYEPATPGGGDGDGANPYDPGDPNPFPDDPPFSIADTGLLEVYIPTNIQLNLLADYLWSSNFITSMVKDLYADPMDVIISLGVLPFYIVAGGTKNIKVGDRDTGVSCSYPRDKYFDLDCGSVPIKSTLGAYIDYAPYTHADIYIPFVGYVPLDIDAFMGHSCGLKYKVEICTGTAVACLMRDNDVWQTFACNMLTPIPLSSANYSQMWQTVIGATATLAGAGIAGAAGMGAAASAGEAAEGAQSISAQSGNAAKASSGIMSAAATKPSIQKSNNVSVVAGILANRKPFILLHRPNLMLPANQNHFQGYPSYVQSSLASLNGYTRVSSINLSVPSATGEEIKMIDAILKSGFIVGDGTPLSGSGIVLGANTSPTHQIKKRVNVVDTLTGTFRDSVDILNPVVRIERENPVGFNYVYISSFGRRYFVEDVTIVRKGILDLHLRVDVLDTFANEILSNTAIIDKQEKTYNLYLNDDSIKMKQNPLVTLLKFPHGLFENNQYTFVLCVAGD